MSMIKLKEVSKYYKSTETVSVGMKKVNLKFDLGEFVAVTGESGSGKSTLLNVISGLDRYEGGELFLFGEETSHYTIADWEKYRGANIGFVFQNYNIIDSYTVLQNVLLALEVQGYDPKTRKQRALDLIEKVGLTSHKNHKASKLSGGQKQRTVIARALAKDCPIIVADEPTGNLDSESSKKVMELLTSVSENKLVVVVTHDYAQVSAYATRKIKMHDGEVTEDKKIKKAELITQYKIPEIKPMHFLTLLRFAVRNIFATPKKLIFLMLLQILVIGVFTLIYTNQISGIRESGLRQSEQFPNVPETRLLIERRDGLEFSDAEIETFKAMKNVRNVYENAANFFNKQHLSISDSQGFDVREINGTDSATNLKSRDVEGRMPIEKNEIVIGAQFSFFELGDTVELHVGRVWDIDDRQGDAIDTFVIVGIDKRDRNILYFSEKFINESSAGDEVVDLSLYQREFWSIVNTISINFQGTDIKVFEGFNQEITDISIFGSGTINTLENQTIIFSAQSSQGIEMTKTIDNLSIEVPDNIDAEAVIEQRTFDRVVKLLMEDIKSEYVVKNDNMISLSISGLFAGNELVSAIDMDTYKVYYPANISDSMREFTVFFRTLFAIVFLTIVGMSSYAVVHAATKNVMNARKKDFAIYRSIGTSKTTLAKLVVLEQVLMSTSGFIITIILLQILGRNVTFISNGLQYMRNQDYFILLGIFMLLGAWLGLRFNRKVFKQSVIETFSESKED